MNINAEIIVTKVEGESFIFNQTNSPKKVTFKNKIFSNDVIATTKNGLALIDFNDEVVGTVLVSPNSQVILRSTKTAGIKLLSVVKGSIRFFKNKEDKFKRSGVLINIRDNETAFIGDHFELNYMDTLKTIEAFSGKVRKIRLTKNTIAKDQLTQKRPKESDLTDQELEEDLKFLLDN